MKKARWIILGLTLVVCIAVYINWEFVNSGNNNFTIADTNDEEYQKILGETTYVNTTETDYFENARYLRQKNRDDSISVLTELINNENADEDAKCAAASAIAGYAETSETEAMLENIIKAKGFSDCIVFLGSDNVSIVVEASGLKPSEAAQLMDIAVSETKFSADVIKIIEIDSVQN